MLKLFGVDISGWGSGATRNIEDYFNELRVGESLLCVDASGVYRKLRIVKMIIEDPKKGILFEDYQVLPDGRRKDRKQAPAGKIGANEKPEEALKRELFEELGITDGNFDYFFDGVSVEERASKSYPNLRCVYEVHLARIKLLGNVVISDGHEIIDKEDGKKLIFCWHGDK